MSKEEDRKAFVNFLSGLLKKDGNEVGPEQEKILEELFEEQRKED